MFSLALPINNGGVLLSARQLSFSNFQSSAGFRVGLQQEEDMRLFSERRQRRRSREIRVLANPNVPPKKEKKEVIMVDPLEAKRLAAKQMEKFKAKEKFKRQRQIEAINGAWAMIGLTAGLVVEGHTGNNILAQLAGYCASLVGFFMR